MKYGILTLDDFNVKGKTVLCRIDINQPVDKEKGTLKDTTRIQACVPTLKELSDIGCKLVLLAHQGSDVEYKNYFTLQPHVRYLQEYLERPVQFVDDVTGPAAREAIKNLKDGEILLLDNVRFVAEEQTIFETKLNLSFEEMTHTQCVEKLAPLADLYVCDAFAAAHRSQPTLCGFELVLPSCMGRLFEAEYSAISQIMQEPEPPCVFVLGGAKIQDAFCMMNTVLEQKIADYVITGGLVGNVMLAAKGISIGNASYDFLQKNNHLENIPIARELLEKYAEKILIPEDMAYVEEAKRGEDRCEKLSDARLYVDIGHQTVEKYKKLLKEAKTIFINGPMGIFEKEASAYGTAEIWNAAVASDGYSVVGGGDSVMAANKFQLSDQFGYICTGGGALVRFLSGEELPVIQALRIAAKRTV